MVKSIFAEGAATVDVASGEDRVLTVTNVALNPAKYPGY